MRFVREGESGAQVGCEEEKEEESGAELCRRIVEEDVGRGTSTI